MRPWAVIKGDVWGKYNEVLIRIIKWRRETRNLRCELSLFQGRIFPGSEETALVMGSLQYILIMLSDSSAKL